MSKRNKNLDTLVEDIYSTIGVLSAGEKIKIPKKLIEELERLKLKAFQDRI